MLKRIFLSYRRDDSAGQAGRLSDRLVREFGRDSLFMDVDEIPLGVDFVKRITEEVAKCDVLLVVIGSRWMDCRDDNNERRLDDPKDFVRVEIRAALQRDIPVIPILIEGTKIPRANTLPEDIRALTVRNGLDLRHASFHADLDRLVRQLKQSARAQPDQVREIAAEPDTAQSAPPIFLNYAREDEFWVRLFLPVFKDVLKTVRILDYSADKVAFDSLEEALDAQIHGAAVVVAFVSKHYRNKQWTVAEWEEGLSEAQRRRLIFVPIMLDPDGIAWWQKLRRNEKLAALPRDYYSDFTKGGKTMLPGPDNPQAVRKIVDLAYRIREELDGRSRSVLPHG